MFLAFRHKPRATNVQVAALLLAIQTWQMHERSSQVTEPTLTVHLTAGGRGIKAISAPYLAQPPVLPHSFFPRFCAEIISNHVHNPMLHISHDIWCISHVESKQKDNPRGPFAFTGQKKYDKWKQKGYLCCNSCFGNNPSGLPINDGIKQKY